MQLHYLGHAGWLFEEGGATLLCDPWQSEAGAFFASWFPFPDNSQVAVPRAVDAVYISHAHQDHLDRDLLRQFPLDTRFIIAPFRDPVLLHALTTLGFRNVTVLQDDETLSVGRMVLRIFRDEDAGWYHDSAVVVHGVTATVFNLNDCRMSEAWLADLGHVDVLLGQFSGANWYPMVYDYQAAHRNTLAAAKRSRGLERLSRSTALCGAALTIPCAGPPAFLDSTLLPYNDVADSDINPFPTMATAVRYLEARGQDAVLAMPGDVIDVVGARHRLVSRMVTPESVYGDLSGYLRAYAQRRQPAIAHRLRSLPAEPEIGAIVTERLTHLASLSTVLTRKINAIVCVHLVGASAADLVFDCTTTPATVRPYRGQAHHYRLTIDHRLIAAIMRDRYVNFEDALLSMRFHAWREPDIFNEALFALLVNFDVERFRRAEQEIVAAEAPSAETFTLTCDNRQYRVQRWCPHLKSDLQIVGHAADGVLTCTRHGWQFRLQDGACLNVQGESLFCEVIESGDQET